MKLTGAKKVLSFLKRSPSSSKVHSGDQQSGSATESSDRRSPGKSLLRHLKITKFQINYAKDFGNEKQVVHYCTKYLDDFPTSYSTLCNRAEAYCKLKKYSRVIDDLSSAILLKPQRSTAWYLRGVVKGLKKSYADALFDLNKAIMFDPNNCLALKCRAYCHYMLESYEEALCDLKLVIISGCGDEATYINKTNIMRILKDSTNKDLEVGSKNGVNDIKGKGKAL
ncbi:hypothetical protein Glove_256g141 [Diversispora epigaea]|uniref:Uncharacterized protein n=1 Tax=Diversispora epigaea TaxID=1348612 RepID=A0A397IFP7_9GLOM|nr:hypothetical protein Glove_256g141 [Diversispora epigaea]